MAEVIIGGNTTEKAVRSEKLLGDLNKVWMECEEKANQSGDFHNKYYGIEGIIEVEIEPKKPTAEHGTVIPGVIVKCCVREFLGGGL